MGQRPRSTTATQYDPKYPWLGTLPWCGAEDPPNPDPNDPDPKDPPDPADPPAPTGDTISKADYDALLERMKAADKNRTTAETKLRELEDKEKGDLEIAQRDLEEHKGKVTQLQTENRELRIQNAFLASNTYKWHDPEAALALADLSNVVIGEDGKVTGLKEALEALSKSKPFLLAEEGDDPKLPTDPTGGPKDGKKKTNNEPNNDDLVRRFPALAGRL